MLGTIGSPQSAKNISVNRSIGCKNSYLSYANRLLVYVNWKVLPHSSSSVAEWCSIFRSQTEFPSTPPPSEVITLCSTGKSVWCLCFCFTFPLFTCQVAEGAEYWLKIIASQCNYTSSVGFYRAGVVRPITIRYTFLFAAQRNEQLF